MVLRVDCRRKPHRPRPPEESGRAATAAQLAGRDCSWMRRLPIPPAALDSDSWSCSTLDSCVSAHVPDRPCSAAPTQVTTRRIPSRPPSAGPGGGGGGRLALMHTPCPRPPSTLPWAAKSTVTPPASLTGRVPSPPPRPLVLPGDSAVVAAVGRHAGSLFHSTPWRGEWLWRAGAVAATVAALAPLRADRMLIAVAAGTLAAERIVEKEERARAALWLEGLSGLWGLILCCHETAGRCWQLEAEYEARARLWRRAACERVEAAESAARRARRNEQARRSEALLERMRRHRLSLALARELQWVHQRARVQLRWTQGRLRIAWWQQSAHPRREAFDRGAVAAREAAARRELATAAAVAEWRLVLLRAEEGEQCARRGLGRAEWAARGRLLLDRGRSLAAAACAAEERLARCVLAESLGRGAAEQGEGEQRRAAARREMLERALATAAAEQAAQCAAWDRLLIGAAEHAGRARAASGEAAARGELWGAALWAEEAAHREAGAGAAGAALGALRLGSAEGAARLEIRLCEGRQVRERSAEAEAHARTACYFTEEEAWVALEQLEAAERSAVATASRAAALQGAERAARALAAFEGEAAADGLAAEAPPPSLPAAAAHWPRAAVAAAELAEREALRRLERSDAAALTGTAEAAAAAACAALAADAAFRARISLEEEAAADGASAEAPPPSLPAAAADWPRAAIAAAELAERAALLREANRGSEHRHTRAALAADAAFRALISLEEEAAADGASAEVPPPSLPAAAADWPRAAIAAAELAERAALLREASGGSEHRHTRAALAADAAFRALISLEEEAAADGASAEAPPPSLPAAAADWPRAAIAAAELAERAALLREANGDAAAAAERAARALTAFEEMAAADGLAAEAPPPLLPAAAADWPRAAVAAAELAEREALRRLERREAAAAEEIASRRLQRAAMSRARLPVAEGAVRAAVAMRADAERMRLAAAGCVDSARRIAADLLRERKRCIRRDWLGDEGPPAVAARRTPLDTPAAMDAVPGADADAHTPAEGLLPSLSNPGAAAPAAPPPPGAPATRISDVISAYLPQKGAELIQKYRQCSRQCRAEVAQAGAQSLADLPPDMTAELVAACRASYDYLSAFDVCSVVEHFASDVDFGRFEECIRCELTHERRLLRAAGQL